MLFPHTLLRKRRLAACTSLVCAAVLSLFAATPVAAAGPVRQAPADIVPRPSADVEPTGVLTCDTKLSLVDGPLVDSGFVVRAWEDFIVWGFGYPPDTELVISFTRAGVSEDYRVTTDSAGEFSDGFYYFNPGSAPEWFASATETGEFPPTLCPPDTDFVDITVLPPYPFTDVDGFEFEIAWLYREGITGGCTATRFCPDNGVSRGQMAAFLNRALGLPGTATDFFDDDDGTIFENDINELAAAGITGGCATRRYCPNSLVTREQMASFLVRAFLLPPSSTDFFTDDETSIHEGSINALAAADITGGCTATRYCPRSNVTREQMAAFLYRAFN